MAWLSGWQYRKKITISGSSGAGTNYQVLLKVGESSGASGAHFHLEGHSANFPSGKNQGGDLRFTSSDGTTLLNFWVESVTGSSPNRVAYIWVKVADNLESSRDIYVYYGNSSATNYSNGDNTFLLFDDFPGTALDTNKWSVYIQDTHMAYSVSNDYLRLSSSKSASNGTWYTINIRSVNTYSLPIEVRSLSRFVAPSSSEIWGGLHGRGGIGYMGAAVSGNYRYINGTMFNYYNKSYLFEVLAGNGTAEQRSNTTNAYSFNTWGIAKVTSYNNVNTAYYNEVQRGQLTYSVNSSNYISLILKIGDLSAGYNTASQYIDFDWVLVKKYVFPEPAFSSAGSEETSSGLYTITITETLSLGEGITRFSQKVVNEIVNLTESIIKFPQKLVSEAINLLESVGIFRFFEKILMETLSLTDSISKSVGKFLTEMISLGETIIKIPQKIITETIDLTEEIITNVKSALPIKPIISRIKMGAKGLATFLRVRGKSKQL